VVVEVTVKNIGGNGSQTISVEVTQGKTTQIIPQTISLDQNASWGLVFSGFDQIVFDSATPWTYTVTVLGSRVAQGNKPPVASISATPTTGPSPFEVQFIGSGSTDSDGSIKAYYWRFGDGSLSSWEMNPTHSFVNRGTYTVNLTVADDEGATDTQSILITVTNRLPTVSAYAQPLFGEPPLTVQFYGFGEDLDGQYGRNVSFLWDFGDGSTSTQHTPADRYSPLHTYTSSGTYTARVTVTDDEGASANQSLTIQVTYLPTATIVANLTSGIEPVNVQFTGSGTDRDGQIVSYHWDFSDGQTSSQQNRSHTYMTNGTYTVTLTVTDNQGGTGTDSMIITVLYNNPPTAVASANTTTGTSPFTVQFTGSGSDRDGQIVSYHWDFGDSTISTQQNPLHTYTSNGTYTATLTVTDERGKTGTDSVTISVQT
jgi:PKD repeat protein